MSTTITGFEDSDFNSAWTTNVGFEITSSESQSGSQSAFSETGGDHLLSEEGDGFSLYIDPGTTFRFAGHVDFGSWYDPEGGVLFGASKDGNGLDGYLLAIRTNYFRAYRLDDGSLTQLGEHNMDVQGTDGFYDYEVTWSESNEITFGRVGGNGTTTVTDSTYTDTGMGFYNSVGDDLWVDDFTIESGGTSPGSAPAAPTNLSATLQ